MQLTCQKRRKIIHTEQDGSKREFYKCAHGTACTYRQEVDESTCDTCVLRQVLLSQRPCGSRPPRKPVYRSPRYGEGGEVCYEPAATEPPGCPEGYQRRATDDWTFDPVWFPCPYRVFNNDLKSDGSLKIKAYCGVAKKPANFEECDRCKGALAQVGVSLNSRDIPEVPGLPTQLQNYWNAVTRWIAAGRPTRTDAEVEFLHGTYCTGCDWYDKKNKRCKGCGCKVKPGGAALLNKVRMTTEHCPRDFW